MPYGFIYLTINIINGKRYIRMCKNTHAKGYLGSGKILRKAIQKYGKESFVRQIIQECASFGELCDAEKFWIHKYDAVNDPLFYNLTSGGFGGNSEYMKTYWGKLTPSERRTARQWSKIPSFSMLGKHHTEVTKKLIGSKSVNRHWGRKTTINGHNNPKAKKVLVVVDGVEKYYDCLKYFHDEYSYIPYSTLKGMARRGKLSTKHGMTVQYV